MFVLLSPAEPPESHLVALGVISRMARDDQWRKEIFSAKKSSDIMRMIRKWEDRAPMNATKRGR